MWCTKAFFFFVASVIFSIRNASSMFSRNSSICSVWSNLEPDSARFLNPGIRLEVLLLMAAERALVIGWTTFSTVNAAILVLDGEALDEEAPEH